VVKGIGSITFRQPEEPHRIELINNEPCWTLFLTGEKTHDWGFVCEEGWKNWSRFID
jgi:hypothetical protein